MYTEEFENPVLRDHPGSLVDLSQS
jgi:hypothetical protein